MNCSHLGRRASNIYVLPQPASSHVDPPFFLRLAEEDGEKESSLEHLANNLNRQYHMSSNHLLAMRRVEFRILSLKQKVGNVLGTDSIASQFQPPDAKQWIHRLSIPEAGGDVVICILAVTLQATSAWWIMEGQRYILWDCQTEE